MDTPPTPLSGLFAERYEIGRQLGRGGTATVFAARDAHGGQTVAIKILHAELSDSVGASRFLHEIRVTAALDHPNIVSVRDSGEWRGRLYLVLDYMEGDTLRAKLQREKQLPIEEAVAITRTIAGALGYAHERGLIHRDLKPENILFADGRPCLADFGIARAIERAVDESVTTTGLVRGTPAYMSPEQAAGGKDYDARSDIFSLGCVLYEMLAGVPAYMGPTPQAVIAQRLVHAPRDVRVYRQNASEELSKVVAKSLELTPADRFATAEVFAVALAAAMQPGTSEPPRARGGMNGRARLVAIGMAVAGGLALAAVGARVWTARAAAMPVDTTRIAVFPIERTDEKAVQLDPALHEALSRWGGITLVDPFQVAEEVRRLGHIQSESDARSAARALGAGRYIRARVADAGGSYLMTGSMYDVHSNEPLRRSVVRFDRTFAGADSVLRSFADTIIIGTGARLVAGPDAGSRSAPALQASAAAFSALDDWNLSKADSLFEAAFVYDPKYYRAALWLAQVRLWNQRDRASWATLAQLTAQNAAQLGERERTLAKALAAMAGDDYAVACSLYDGLARRNDRDFAALYGAGECRRNDHVVVRDRASRSGWSFRSSPNRMIEAYARAFELLPSVYQSFQLGAYQQLRDLLYTSPRRLRSGTAMKPDTGQFLAYPELDHDSLAFVPQPAQAVFSGTQWTDATLRAATRQRLTFARIARTWASALPHNSGAKEAVAVALDMLGDPSALDTLQLARTLATDPTDKLRLATAEVFLSFRLALPRDIRRLENVAQVADSLLSANARPGPSVAPMLATLAALRGHCTQAADLDARSATPIERPVALSAALVATSRALTVASAMGCADTARSTQVRELGAGIGLIEDRSRRSMAEQFLLARALHLSFPADSSWTHRVALSTGDFILAAQYAAERGDTGAVRRALQRIGLNHSSTPASENVSDALVPQVQLALMIGDTTTAATWLDDYLDAARAYPPTAFTEAPRVASIVRCMSLRAAIAIRRRDAATARMWARVIAVLWSGSEAARNPDIQSVLQLTKS
jgi:tRNA A-37 threonylcarbamoyl transferase component Bud32